MSAPKFCANCGLSQALHAREGQHPAVLELSDGYQCERFVSQAEAVEVSQVVRELLRGKEEVER